MFIKHKTTPLSKVEDMIDELLTENSDATDEPSANLKLAIENKGGVNSMTSIQLSGACTIYEITQLHQQIHENSAITCQFEQQSKSIS